MANRSMLAEPVNIEAAILGDQSATEARVVAEACAPRQLSRAEQRADFRRRHAEAQRDLDAESRKLVDDCGVEFRLGASVVASQSIPYAESGFTGLRHTQPGTRGEIVAFAGTREYPTVAVQFDGRRTVHLFAAQMLRAAVRVAA